MDQDHHHHHQFLPPQHHYEEPDYGAPPLAPQRPATERSFSGRKRSADELEDDELGSLEGGHVERDVKDEDSPAGVGSIGQSGSKANQAARKNRSAAPPLKRGTACMLCRKRKLVSSITLRFAQNLDLED